MIYKNTRKLIDYALANELISPTDVYVVRNQLMEALCLTDWEEVPSDYSTAESIDDILAPLVDYACEKGIIADTSNSRDLFDTKLMGILTPMPREVAFAFSHFRSYGADKATDWYYDFSKKTNYVRAGRIAKDLKWIYNCEYGALDITVNCSKPEKDPRDIALAKTKKASAYPKCQLCAENAGYAGRADHPARQNLRPIPIKVANSDWQLQYSPYGYYNEHCIAFNTLHTPMVIDGEVFGKMFDIIEYLPHYFVGSNADLPIVGGSILAHEHFQGGNYDFAMAKADIETPFLLSRYPDVSAGIVKWPMSVIRVSSSNRASLQECCAHILSAWRNYTDESAFIFANTDGEPHNTITPIARMNGGLYECDLVLRNNITTQDRPMGLYHPNPSLHHIKKENIGLIEVMGLAVLPARLSKEIVLLENAVLSNKDVASDSAISHHAEWIKQIISNRNDINPETVRTVLQEEIGKVFLQVLEDAGVYKRTPEGKSAFLRFVSSL